MLIYQIMRQKKNILIHPLAAIFIFLWQKMDKTQKSDKNVSITVLGMRSIQYIVVPIANAS